MDTIYSEEDDGLMADSTLPQLAHLLTLHTTQDEDLQHKNHTLQLMEDLIDKEVQAQDEIHRNLQQVDKELRTSEEMSSELERNCTRKTKELNNKVTNFLELKRTLTILEEEKKEAKETVEVYGLKMSSHNSSNDRELEQVEYETKTLQMQIKSLKTSWAELNKDKVKKDKDQSFIIEKIQNSIEEKKLLTETSEALLKEIETLEEDIKQLSSEVLVARKRNHAQLTRLHHQLQEAQSKQHHWIKEKSQLMSIIKELKQSLIEE